MNLSELSREKKKYGELIRSEYDFPKNNKCIWLIKIADKEILKKLVKWLQFLPANFIVISGEVFDKAPKNVVFVEDILTYEIWADFVVWDDEESLERYFKAWITPIFYQKSPLSSLLSEFNPMKNEWNSFLYESSNAWSIFYTIVKYLENYKFPFDNKNLVKNVFES